MKANELRIGNYVYDTLGTVNKIDLEAITYIAKEPHNKVKPIPLTEEWLLKFGFEKLNVYCFGNHKLIIESLISDRHSCRYRINPNESIWISELHYVHQLQNLYFALTGEELNFKSE